MTSLKQYLDKRVTLAHTLSDAYFARELGITTTHLSRIKYRKCRPGYDLAKLIVNATDGEVGLAELMEEKKTTKSKRKDK